MASSKEGYWVEIVDGKTLFMYEANGWQILQDGKVLQFYKDSAEECIISTFTLRNVIQWYYGERR